MYSLLKLLFCLSLLLLLNACLGKPVQPTIGTDRHEISEPIVYIVKADNESLREIAQWYTGKASNSIILFNYNRSNLKNRLKKGDVILIPQNLLTTRKPFVKKNSPKGSTEKKAGKARDNESREEIPKPAKKELQTVEQPPKLDIPKSENAEITPSPVQEESPVSKEESRRIELLKELMEK